MIIHWIFAALHLLALGIGLGAIWARRQALRARLDGLQAFRRVFYADNLWGFAALLWIATGVTRAFGGLEKGTEYYVHNGFFAAKMALLLAILVLEIWPMSTLIRWRIKLRRGQRVQTGSAARMAQISTVEAFLVILMVFAATAMARGLGAAAI